MFSNFFNFTSSKCNIYLFCEMLAGFFQQLCIYTSLMLFVLFLITILFVKLTTSNRKFIIIFSLIKYSNMLLVGFVFILILLKFLLYLWSYKFLGFLIGNGSWQTETFYYYLSSFSMNLNSSILSDVIVLLAFSSGIVCLYLLGEKNLSNYLSNLSIFSIFLVAIIFMVYTTNLLIMFVGFEFLFAPTLYFVYSHGYVQRADKTIKILLYWTLFGAFLVFSSIGYIYAKYKTLNYFELASLDFSIMESIFLYIFIFIGFGIKVPVFPFHYWLTKIHVEAPAGFSIFLSGFLVKAAIYCFYYFNLIFNLEILVEFTSAVALIGVIESSIKMWTQTDFKKLIAFATIQEMNLILYLLLNYQNLLDYSLILFILVHGWLSTLMFFSVDIIQKKTSSRNILEVCGLAYNFPEIKLIMWFILLLFSGFPLTIKFLIEWQILGNLVLQNKILFIVGFFVVVVIGVCGFAKQMIIILYGVPRHKLTVNYTMSKRDKYLFYVIILILILLNILNFFLAKSKS